MALVVVAGIVSPRQLGDGLLGAAAQRNRRRFRQLPSSRVGPARGGFSFTGAGWELGATWQEGLRPCSIVPHGRAWYRGREPEAGELGSRAAGRTGAGQLGSWADGPRGRSCTELRRHQGTRPCGRIWQRCGSITVPGLVGGVVRDMGASQYLARFSADIGDDPAVPA